MAHAFAHTLKTFKTASGKAGKFCSLPELAKQYPNVNQLPVSIRIVLESVLRNCDGKKVTAEHVRAAGQLGSRTPSAPTRSRSSSRAWCCRTSPACRCWSTWPRCAAWPQRMGKNPKTIEPLVPVDLVVDHSVHGRLLRHAEGARPEHEAGVPAQPRALPVHEVGHAGLRHLRRRAAGLRHRAPGEPRVPRARRATRAERQGVRLLPRHAGRHRQPHDHDQRHRRGRLGRRRHRGRGRHAGPAGVLPDARRGGLRAHRQAARRRHRHRPGAHRHRDAAQARRWSASSSSSSARARQRCRCPTARPSATWRPSTARRWASSRSTRRPSTTSRAPAAPKTEIERFEAYYKAQGLFGMPAPGEHRLHARSSSSTSAPSRPAWPARSARRTASTSATWRPSSPSCYSKPIEANGFNQPADKLQLRSPAGARPARRRRAASAAEPQAGRAARRGRDGRPTARRTAAHIGGTAPTRRRRRDHRQRRRADRRHHLAAPTPPTRACCWPPACWRRRRWRRADGQAARQDLAGARLAHRHRVPREGGPAAVPRKARLLPGRLRLHHLHRQRRRPGARDQRGDHEERPGRARRCCRATATSRRASTRTSRPTS